MYNNHDGAVAAGTNIETYNEVMEVMYTQHVGNGEVRDHELTCQRKGEIEEAKKEGMESIVET